MKISGYFKYVCLLAFVTVNAILLGYVTSSDITIGALKAALPLSNSTDQMVRIQSVISNHSDDIKAIRNSTSAQVQVLKSIAQDFAISSVMFATLAVFLLGVTLVIYGLRLTLRGAKQTSRYFKVIMCALLSPVIVIIMAYQLGIAFRAPLEIYKIASPLLIISLLLWIPTGVIVFLLVADRKLMQHLEHHQ
jgi:hypothetical protein